MAANNKQTAEVTTIRREIIMSVEQTDLDMSDGKITEKMIEEEEAIANGNEVIIEEGQVIETPSTCCVGLRLACHSCTKPARTKYNPLPEEPSCFQRFKFGLLCPPHGNLAKYIMFIVMFGVAWAVAISVTGAGGLPGGNFFSLCVLFFACVVGGYLVTFIKLPPLLGMLIVGCVLRNVPGIDIVGTNIENSWSAAMRKIALTIILTRAGLGLDPKALRRLSWAVLRLAFSPCLMECLTEAIAAHFLLGFPWIWALMLGFVLAAVSPAVVVPSLLNLSDRGYGINKGIPTLVIAAASIDDVLAITGFGVMLGIAFSTGDLAWSIIKGPIEALVGVAYGVIVGMLIWYIPSRASRHVVLYRTFLLLGFGCMATFGSSVMEFPGAGPLGCLTMAFVAAFKWRKEDWSKEGGDPMPSIVAILWMIFQPLLFGLIGAEVDIAKIDGSTVGLGIATLGIGMVVRLVVSFFTVWGTNLNMKERLFIPFAWLPKATVQAAIGALALDKAREVGGKPEEEILGKQILTLAVLSILITAPIGAAIIAISGPILLHHTPKEGEEGQELQDMNTDAVVKEEEGMLLKEKEEEES